MAYSQLSDAVLTQEDFAYFGKVDKAKSRGKYAEPLDVDAKLNDSGLRKHVEHYWKVTILISKAKLSF